MNQETLERFAGVLESAAKEIRSLTPKPEPEIELPTRKFWELWAKDEFSAMGEDERRAVHLARAILDGKVEDVRKP